MAASRACRVGASGVGGFGDDVLTGGRGSDVFVFGASFGHAVLTDFKPVEDDIRLVGAGFADFNDVLAHAVQGAVGRLALDFEVALQRCARGDQYALRAIYERERRWLMATALRLVRR